MAFEWVFVDVLVPLLVVVVVVVFFVIVAVLVVVALVSLGLTCTLSVLLVV